MSQAAPRGPRFLLPAVAAAAILLWLISVATSRHPLFGAPSVHLVIEAAAVIATAFLFVIGSGWLILSLAASKETGAHPAGLQRVLVYALVTFIAAFAALRHFDFDLGAALTTSAIVTAAIGFAMQPTLGSMIAGITLQIDRLPRVGDGILLDGQAVRIEALDWRRVVARRRNGALILIPNAGLADHTVEILPHDAPIRAETCFQAPFALPPHRISRLVADLMSDLAAVDAGQPITVVPTEYDASHGSLRYRIHYQVHRYRDMAELEGEILGRLWYLFQRERLWRPADAPGADRTAAWHAPAELARRIVRLDLPVLAATSAEAGLALATESEVLLFAPGERLTLPDWTEGWRYLLLDGEAVSAAEADSMRGLDAGLSGGAAPGVAASVALHRARAELAAHIGPFAEHAVRRAARPGRDLAEIFRELAGEIPDEAARSNFLDRMLPEQPPRFGAGLILETHRNAAGALVCTNPLRALSEVTILAMPPGLRERGREFPPPSEREEKGSE